MNERLSKTTYPTLGRFLSRDPIGFAGGLNQNSYADNNPTTMADPSGLYSVYDLLNPQTAIDWYSSKADSYITDSYLSALHPGALLFRTMGVGTSMTPPAAAQDFAIAWGDQTTSGLWKAWTAFGFATSLTPFGIGSRASTSTVGSVSRGLRSQRCGGFAQFGKNSMAKIKKHWRIVRRTGRDLGLKISQKFKNASKAEIEDFVDYVVDGSERLGTGPYYPNAGGSEWALWSKRGNAVVIRKPDGDFLTVLDAAEGGATKNFPGGLD